MKKLFLILVIIFGFGVESYAQTQPYIILISLDGFRWDYANRGITPNIEYMKEHGASAISLRPDFPSKTFPNHYSIVTGMYPENHGLIANSFINPFTHEKYKNSDPNSSTDGKWYLGEALWETAKRNGIKTASYFWPGSELKLDYRRPDYFEHYEQDRPYDKRIQGVIDWLQLPEKVRPHFVTLYFDTTDLAGHDFGPESQKINNAIMYADSALGKLFEKLHEINMFDKVNIILVSDHGMTSVSNKRVVNVEEILKNYKITYQENGPFMLIQPEKSKVEEVYEKLKQNDNQFRVFKRKEIPACYHYSDNPFISDIVLFADLGWSLVDNRSAKWMEKVDEGGNHGFDNFTLDMNGIFYAIGPAFKEGYRTGTVNNIDIYPLMCKIFDITPRSNIDGNFENIEFLLKGY
ncbi:MAG TPA: alkaline phosphatase family protein [Ignavibacteriaceae bacterium]|nr:alkaline phosphatase family protein [Ignavibacteriaceae bacterium]